MKQKRSLLSFLFSSAVALSAVAGTANFTVLDVRTPEEYQESHLKDSVLIDVLKPDFKQRIAKLDKNKAYKLYCRSGNRSGQALQIMKAQGFKDVENLGSLHEASVKLKRACDGNGPC